MAKKGTERSRAKKETESVNHLLLDKKWTNNKNKKVVYFSSSYRDTSTFTDLTRLSFVVYFVERKKVTLEPWHFLQFFLNTYTPLGC